MSLGLGFQITEAYPGYTPRYSPHDHMRSHFYVTSLQTKLD